MKNSIIHQIKGLVKWLSPLYLLCFLPISASAQQLTEKYNAQRPVVVVCDWDKPPYEFLNDQGEPAGSNIDVLTTLFDELNIPYKFILKEWGNAIKTFERGEVDIILANARRYRKKPYYVSNNIVNYNRIVAATAKSTSAIHFSLRELVDQGLVLKPSDYSVFYFLNEDSAYVHRIEFQSPKVAIKGLQEGDYNYFVWGEEPLKWKLKELNMKNIQLTEVNIPISEIHIIGRDKELVETLDDHFSRLKQSGKLEDIQNRWFHPERIQRKSIPTAVYIIAAIIAMLVILYLLNRLVHAHIRRATRESTDINYMILKALHMGNFQIMEYDIARNHMVNKYGKILPDAGLTLEEFTRRIAPERQEDFTQKMQRLLSGRDRKLGLNLHWNAGTAEKPQWLLLEGHAIVELDDHGHPTYVVHTVNNLTRDIEKEEQNYETMMCMKVLAQIPFIGVSYYDSDGFLVTLNDTMKKICGFSDTDPKIERFWRKICMFDAPLFRNAVEPGITRDQHICQHMLYPDMGIDRYIEFCIHPIYDHQQKLINYFVTAIDVTDDYGYVSKEHKNIRQLEDTRQIINRYDQLLRHIAKISNLYMWHTNLQEGTISFYQSLQNTPKTEESIEEFFSHMVESERDVARHFFTNTSPEQSDMNLIYHFDNSVVAKGERWFHMKATPWYNHEGNVMGHKGFCYDMTDIMLVRKELKAVTQRAKDSGKIKSGFMASMTHELRTPLNAIMGFSEVLSMSDKESTRIESIRIMRNACDMLQRLINDILEVSFVTESTDSVTPVDVDFAQAFNDICIMLEQRVTDAGLQFLHESPCETYPTRIDMGRIQQIVTNFVTNACKFTKQGHIKIGYQVTEGEEHGLYIYCEDTGAGIPKEKQALIFDRFVKLDEYSQGTGLGLNICKAIAERCGGHIGVHSDGLGKGSTFWIWIPCEKS